MNEILLSKLLIIISIVFEFRKNMLLDAKVLKALFNPILTFSSGNSAPITSNWASLRTSRNIVTPELKQVRLIRTNVNTMTYYFKYCISLWFFFSHANLFLHIFVLNCRAESINQYVSNSLVSKRETGLEQERNYYRISCACFSKKWW